MSRKAMRQYEREQRRNIDDVFIGTHPGCSRPEHSDEIVSMMFLLDGGARWPGTSRMDCGCVNRLFAHPPDEAELDDWRRRLDAGTEPVDYLDPVTGEWVYG